MQGFIKIDRKITEWGWYTDHKTFKLFFHLLLSANFKDAYFLGELIKRGQIARSVDSLSSETGLTRDELKTAIKHLIKTGDIICKSYTKYTLFTITNYDYFQSDCQAFAKPMPNDCKTVAKPIPNDYRQINNYNKYNNDNNDNNDNNLWVSNELDDEFFKISRAHSVSNV